MCRRNKGQSRRRRLICSRRRACSEEFKLTMIGEGTAVSGATLGGFALSGVAKEVCRGPYQFLPRVRPMPWFDLVCSRSHDAACAGGWETQCPPAVRRGLRSCVPYEASAEPCAHSRTHRSSSHPPAATGATRAV